MKIAVFGATGLLGSSLVNNYYELGISVIGISRSDSVNLNKIRNFTIDYENLTFNCEKIFENWKPDLIINTVANVNLDQCEVDFNLAKKVNVDMAVDIALLAKKYNAKFIHISTDHYYDDQNIQHKETDDVVILNNYAKTKFMAESTVLRVNEEALVVRTNIIGFRNTSRMSFFEWLLENLENKREIVMYTNFHTSPICTKFLGDILLKAFTKNLIGLYNISGSDVISKYDFSVLVAQKFSFEFGKVSKGELIDNENNKTKRSKMLGLCNSKIEKALNLKMPPVGDSIDQLYQEYKNKNQGRIYE